MIKFLEIDGFGINILSLTFVVTLISTAFQAIAFIKQNKKILKARSSKSVSFSFYSFFGFSALAITVYGLHNQSLALSINGLLGFLSLAIAVNIFKFRKLTEKEISTGLFSTIAVPLMIIAPEKDYVFLGLGLIIGVTLMIQILEIWKNKSSGAYHSGQIFVSITSCSFWLIYSIIVIIYPMIITNSLFLFLWILLLFSYLKFRNVEIIKSRN